MRIYNDDGTDYDWGPNLTYWTEGGYDAFVDTNGCLYLGGDFTGNVDGFGRMCPVLAPASPSAGTVLGSVTISWDEPGIVGSGIDYYEVSRDGAVLGIVTDTSLVDETVVEGEIYSYSIVAVSESGTRGAESEPIDVTATAADDPVVDPVGDQSDPVGSPIALLAIVAFDPDGGDVTFVASGLPSGLSINPATGVISGTPDTVEDPTVTVTVTDDESASTQIAFDWSVFDPDVEPPPDDADPPRTCPADETPFVDVSPTSFALADIACIFGLGITTGTSLTTYDPAGYVTREQMAAFVARLWRALGGVCRADATPFVDVLPTSFALADIACIFGLGITTGTSLTTYDPAGYVTREQMAAFVARLWRRAISDGVAV